MQHALVCVSAADLLSALGWLAICGAAWGWGFATGRIMQRRAAARDSGALIR